MMQRLMPFSVPFLLALIVIMFVGCTLYFTFGAQHQLAAQHQSLTRRLQQLKQYQQQLQQQPITDSNRATVQSLQWLLSQWAEQAQLKLILSQPSHHDHAFSLQVQGNQQDILAFLQRLASHTWSVKLSTELLQWRQLGGRDGGQYQLRWHFVQDADDAKSVLVALPSTSTQQATTGSSCDNKPAVDVNAPALAPLKLAAIVGKREGQSILYSAQFLEPSGQFVARQVGDWFNQPTSHIISIQPQQVTLRQWRYHDQCWSSITKILSLAKGQH